MLERDPMAERAQRGPVSQYVLCYALFAALIALVVYVVFIIWRYAIDDLVHRFVEKTWAYNAFQNFGLLGLTIVGFVLVMAAEPYLRHGIARHEVLRRFGKLALPIVIAGAAGLLLQVWVKTM